ncbi:MAG: cold shock domain-containing protein [Bacteroidota bacterium]
MASSQETYNKRDQEKKRLKKRLDKQQKVAERKANSQNSTGNMIAYVDEYGNITDTPPDPAKRRIIDAGSIEIGVPKREMIEVPSVRKGRVEFFNHSKGFGFIKETDSQEKFFVHVNNVTEEIKEGDMVTFELERGFKGMSAVGVKKGS